MNLPFGIQQSTLAGGLSGLATWGIGLGLTALGITVPPTVIAGLVTVIIPVVVHFVPDAAKVDADIKEVAAVLPTATPDYSAALPRDGAFAQSITSQGQANSNINQG